MIPIGFFHTWDSVHCFRSAENNWRLGKPLSFSFQVDGEYWWETFSSLESRLDCSQFFCISWIGILWANLVPLCPLQTILFLLLPQCHTGILTLSEYRWSGPSVSSSKVLCYEYIWMIILWVRRQRGERVSGVTIENRCIQTGSIGGAIWQLEEPCFNANCWAASIAIVIPIFELHFYALFIRDTSHGHVYRRQTISKISKYLATRSLGPLRGPTSSWRLFGPAWFLPSRPSGAQAVWPTPPSITG